ncbi:hypothetical protein CHELA41_22879 [Hyphomicrobiales bacterium]|nr:hypothetical protein CHELA41_22879 [Hyphomicrobiales bacterium]
MFPRIFFTRTGFHFVRKCSSAACSPPDLAGARPPSPEGRDQRGLHPFSSPSREDLNDPAPALRRLLPFHDMAIRNAAIARAPVGRAAVGVGLVEMAQDEACRDERLHVARQRPVPVLDADATPFHPFGALVEIVADHEAAFQRWVVPGPSGREAVEIDDDEAAAGAENPRHLVDGRCRIRDVDQREIADDEVEHIVGEGERLSPSLPVIALGIAAPCLGEHVFGRVKADGVDAAFAQHAAEAPLAAADIEAVAVATPLDPLKDRPIGHKLPGKVTVLSHIGDPGSSRFIPSVGHGNTSLMKKGGVPRMNPWMRQLFRTFTVPFRHGKLVAKPICKARARVDYR